MATIRAENHRVAIFRFLVALCLMGVCTGCRSLGDLVAVSPLWRLTTGTKPIVPRAEWSAGDTISTVNYMDSVNNRPVGYCYTVDSGVVRYRTGYFAPGEWRCLPGGNPVDCRGETLSVLRLAADNNRVFVLATSKTGRRSLWWYCVKPDLAVWSGQLINYMGDFLHEGYNAWTRCAHDTTSAGRHWTNLMGLRSFVYYQEPRYVTLPADSTGQKKVQVVANRVPRLSLDVDDVVDIAVGNWKSTVITYYVLLGSTGNIHYIDEEVVMERWQTVPRSRLPSNAPYPLDAHALMAASNSVIGVYKPIFSGNGAYRTSVFSWIRWDFHNPEDFNGVLNWCQSTWTTDTCNIPEVTSIGVNSHWPPGNAGDSIWAVPRFLQFGDRTGFLGSIPENIVRAYPVTVTFHRVNRPDTVLCYVPVNGTWIKAASLSATTGAELVAEKSVWFKRVVYSAARFFQDAVIAFRNGLHPPGGLKGR